MKAKRREISLCAGRVRNDVRGGATFMSELKLRLPRREDGEINSPLRYFLRGALEEFVDQSLIGLGLLGGEAAKLGEETRSDADGDELFGVAGPRPTDTAGATELFASRFRDVGEVD